MEIPPAAPAPAWQRAMDALYRVAMTLALGVTVLLFLQWPLRDVVGAGSTQANDMAQILFALYVACALRHAVVRGAHLVARPDLAAPAAPRSWRRIGAALCVLPWAVGMLALSAPSVLQSVRTLERFPESFNPGYFVIKIAMWLLALLLALQSLQDLRQAMRRRTR